MFGNIYLKSDSDIIEVNYLNNLDKKSLLHI